MIKYPPINSPLEIYKFLDQIDAFSKIEELSIELINNDVLKPLFDEIINLAENYQNNR